MRTLANAPPRKRLLAPADTDTAQFFYVLHRVAAVSADSTPRRRYQLQTFCQAQIACAYAERLGGGRNAVCLLLFEHTGILKLAAKFVQTNTSRFAGG